MVRAFKLEKDDIIDIKVTKKIHIIDNYKKIKVGDCVGFYNNDHILIKTNNIDDCKTVLTVIAIIKQNLLKRLFNLIRRKENYTTFIMRVIKT